MLRLLMILKVQYHDGKFDYVSDSALAKLIHKNAIKRFYRPSEAKWTVVGIDPVRGWGGRYTGPERRQSI